MRLKLVCDSCLHQWCCLPAAGVLKVCLAVAPVCSLACISAQLPRGTASTGNPRATTTTTAPIRSTHPPIVPPSRHASIYPSLYPPIRPFTQCSLPPAFARPWRCRPLRTCRLRVAAGGLPGQGRLPGAADACGIPGCEKSCRGSEWCDVCVCVCVCCSLETCTVMLTSC